MKARILIATPNMGIGVLINQSLKEAGGYFVVVVKNAIDALKMIKENPTTICILDAGLKDIQIQELILKIKEMDDDISLIVIPTGEEDKKFKVEDLGVDGILPFPFYNPEFMSLLDDILKKDNLADTQESIKVEKDEKLPSADDIVDGNSDSNWLEDVSYAKEQLTRLSLGSTSLGSVITREGKIWTFAGELSKAAADELALFVEKYFGDKGGSDLARFVHLNETDKDYMLYVTNLREEFVLSMVFDSKTPFSKIRSQANETANDLKNLSAQESLEKYKNKLKFQKSNLLKIKSLLETDFSKPTPAEVEKDPQIISNADPNIEKISVSEVSIEDEAENLVEEKLGETQRSVSNDEWQIGEPKVEQTEKDRFAETVHSKLSPDDEASEDIHLEPVSPSVYNLNYACVLIPRFSEQYLIGDRASRLSEWVTQLCLAFGWRLEQLSIRPEYIQWIVDVPPSTSPGYLIRIIRQHTSRRMLSEFPHLGTTNPSGDYWAPGYLIMNGNQPPPVKLIKEFIKNSRTRQGV